MAESPACLGPMPLALASNPSAFLDAGDHWYSCWNRLQGHAPKEPLLVRLGSALRVESQAVLQVESQAA